MKKEEKYKLHIKNEDTGKQYLCVSCDNGNQYGSRFINKRELVGLYHAITDCLIGGYKGIADASIENSISIYKRGKNYMLHCRDDGSNFYIDKYTLLPLQGEIERILLNIIPKKCYPLNRTTNSKLTQLELF